MVAVEGKIEPKNKLKNYYLLLLKREKYYDYMMNGTTSSDF